MRKMEHAMYFAYGSNMNLDQMAYRCPAAEAVCTAKLEGYELFFAGRPERRCKHPAETGRHGGGRAVEAYGSL